jgi:hypothetical protein
LGDAKYREKIIHCKRRYWKCRTEYGKTLEIRREIRGNKLSDQAEGWKEDKRSRIILKTRNDNIGVNPDNWIKHFSELFTIPQADSSLSEVHIFYPDYTEELDTDFTDQQVRKLVNSMKDNKLAGFNGIPAEAWKMLSTRHKEIEMLIHLFHNIKNKKETPRD